MSENNNYVNSVSNWLRDGIWRLRLADLPWYQAAPVRWLRIVLLSLRGFSEDHASIRASALTYYSVLAVVPLAALAFGIAKGFGVEAMLQDLLRERLAGQEEIASRIIEFSQNQLQQTKGGIVAGAGIMLLFWTATRVLANIEVSFNAVWNTKHSRGFFRKIGDYLAMLILAPLFLIAASSMTVFLLNSLDAFAGQFALWGISQSAAALVARLLPATLLWLFFSAMYLFMPNRRVPVVSAVVGGIAAGTLYQIVQAIYIHFQIGVSAYGAIYGSFAALPLFLIWLQLSWTIVLYGAELANAHEHASEYETVPGHDTIGPALREYAALGVMHRCVQAIRRGESPPDVDAISHDTRLPRHLAEAAVQDLLALKLLVAAGYGADEETPGYFPARDAGSLTIAEVLNALRESGAADIPRTGAAALQQLRDSRLALNQALVDAPENLRFAEVE
ncbi:MAG: YihY family inner membrane protein [Candidatus Hydrogenedens sp.]|nr:YihY family inner membrane protein [Candidatus Hydrogenedens sp.]